MQDSNRRIGWMVKSADGSNWKKGKRGKMKRKEKRTGEERPAISLSLSVCSTLSASPHSALSPLRVSRAPCLAPSPPH